MNLEIYLDIKQKVIDAGYVHEIDWAENVKPCQTADDFFLEYMWIVLNAGMKEQIARIIQRRIYGAWKRGESTCSAFHHKGKVEAIDKTRTRQERIFLEYRIAQNKIEFLKSLPWIGNITKYHLAKNLGFDCCKPDRHLTRIATFYNTTPETLCQKLSQESGDRIATVDLILWRAANLGIINTRNHNATT